MSLDAVPPLPALSQAIEVAWNGDVARAREIYGFDSMDARSRSFNLIRGRLLKLKQHRKWRTFGVVSATPNVGKSYIAANLAATLSRDPRLQTYLLDLDLRRGSVTSQFALLPEVGLKEHFESGDPLNAYRLAGENLIILPTSAGMVHSAELLAGERAQALFRAMKTSAEENLFLVDLPPVFANDDAVIATSRLDAYILVAEEGKSTQRDISNAVEQLGEQRLAGVILNKFRGGLLSEGYGVDAYYARGYYRRDEAQSE